MRQYMPYINLIPIVMDGGYQSVFVAANIEYRKFSHLVYRRKHSLDLGKRSKIGSRHNGIPDIQGGYRCPVPCAKPP